MFILDYTTKYCGYDIKIYKDEDNEDCVGFICKGEKRVGFKNHKGDLYYMEANNNKTNIYNKIKTYIDNFFMNKDKYEEVELRRVDNLGYIYSDKFTKGNILVEKNINMAIVQDVIVVIDSYDVYDEKYHVLTFTNNKNDDNELDINEEYHNKDDLEDKYISIGTDTSILDNYQEILDKQQEIVALKTSIESKVETSLKMLDKTIDDFYDDLVKTIYASDVTEYEKDKYLEFISASYNNKKAETNIF